MICDTKELQRCRMLRSQSKLIYLNGYLASDHLFGAAAEFLELYSLCLVSKQLDSSQKCRVPSYVSRHI